MATNVSKARIEKQQAWRENVDTALLMKLLQKHASGQSDMKKTQIDAARILLAKTVPDLKAIEHTGDVKVHGDFHIHFQ